MRLWLAALGALALWLLSAYLNEPRRVQPASAPVGEFSADRAQRLLARLLPVERAHPVSSAENAAVASRIGAEFARLGVRMQDHAAFACDARDDFGLIACATVHDLIAEVLPGPGPAVIMMGHYDSVPAGAGVADDLSGVAAILEATRALRASGLKPSHPVLAVITDAEEAGLVGAYAFLQDHALRARVGAVVNVDARGTRGPSLLFQTSRGDGRLVDLYARSVPAPATSSLYAEIYRHLPNDTDLTPFLQAGVPSFNFAFIENVQAYHSPLDLRRNLSGATLQMQGDNLLGVVRALARTPYAALHGDDDVYLSLFNAIVPRMPARWALPLSILVWLGIAVALWLAPRPAVRGGWIRVLLVPPLLIGGCAAAGFVLEAIARGVSGMPDPTYAHAIALRVALALGVWTVALIGGRLLDIRHAAAAAWLWTATLAALSAALLPGVSPYFLLPSLVAALALLVTARARGGWAGRRIQGALLVSALVALVVWTGLMAGGEAVMGLRLHLLFTVPAALAMITLLPLMQARAVARTPWVASVAASGCLALVSAVIAGLLPTYSTGAPQRVNLLYVQEAHGARWVARSSAIATDSAPLPTQLLRAARFTAVADLPAVLGGGSAVAAAAGAPEFVLPTGRIERSAPSTPVAPTGGALHRTTIRLQGSSAADAMLLYVPSSARLRSLELRGQRIATNDWNGPTRMLCLSRDCAELTVTLSWDGVPSVLELAEARYGLPASGAFLQRARPVTAMPSQSGDEVLLVNELALQ